MVFPIIIIICEHKNLTASKLLVLLSFELFPSIGGVLQILFLGTLFTYPAAAMALVIIYLYLSEDISILDQVSKAYSNKYLVNFLNNNIINVKKSNYSLAYIDIDSLGKINLEYGEKEGDFLLEKFVEIVNACISQPDFIANIGGDEFIIYFDNNDETQIINNLKIISRNVEYYNRTSKKPYNINFTFTYFINKSSRNSPHKILKTLYYKLCNKKEKMLFENTYKNYNKENKIMS